MTCELRLSAGSCVYTNASIRRLLAFIVNKQSRCRRLTSAVLRIEGLHTFSSPGTLESSTKSCRSDQSTLGLGWHGAEHGYPNRAGPACFHLGTEPSATCVNISACAEPAIKSLCKRGYSYCSSIPQGHSCSRTLLFQDTLVPGPSCSRTLLFQDTCSRTRTLLFQDTCSRTLVPGHSCSRTLLFQDTLFPGHSCSRTLLFQDALVPGHSCLRVLSLAKLANCPISQKNCPH